MLLLMLRSDGIKINTVCICLAMALNRSCEWEILTIIYNIDGDGHVGSGAYDGYKTIDYVLNDRTIGRFNGFDDIDITKLVYLLLGVMILI